jgi:hypothetical protein
MVTSFSEHRCSIVNNPMRHFHDAAEESAASSAAVPLLSSASNSPCGYGAPEGLPNP